MWLKPQGYARADGERVGAIRLDSRRNKVLYFPGQVAQFDTFTCFHCNKVNHVPAKCRPEDIGGLCKICMNLICPKCTSLSRCTPFEEKLRKWAARTEALRSYGL